MYKIEITFFQFKSIGFPVILLTVIATERKQSHDWYVKVLDYFVVKTPSNDRLSYFFAIKNQHRLFIVVLVFNFFWVNRTIS